MLLGPALKHVSWQIALYAVLSLTLVRMLPVAIAMIGTGARAPTVGVLGWFGPRGLASIVFAVIVVEEAHLPGAATILTTTYVTIGLSVIAHGITAAPLATRYARWYESHPAGPPPGDGKRPHTRPPHPQGHARRRSGSPPGGAYCAVPEVDRPALACAISVTVSRQSAARSRSTPQLVAGQAFAARSSSRYRRALDH